ncbi:MAG: c-type cytochrome [Planctomycetota bacterium]
MSDSSIPLPASRLFAVLLVASTVACSESKPAGGGAQNSGAALFQKNGCATCHSADGRGTALGPKLVGVAVHWKRDTLVEYLKDPQAYAAKDARLAAQGKQYMMPMTKFGMLPREQLAALADHVLALR